MIKETFTYKGKVYAIEKANEEFKCKSCSFFNEKFFYCENIPFNCISTNIIARLINY